MALAEDGNHVNWITTTVCNGLTQFLETVVEKPGEYRFDQHPIPPIKVLRPGSDLRTSIAPELIVDLMYHELSTVVEAYAKSLSPDFAEVYLEKALGRLREQRQEHRELIQEPRKEVHNGEVADWQKWFVKHQEHDE
jgi:hypothetical protein